MQINEEREKRMKSPLFEGIDYDHQVSHLDLEFIKECHWRDALARNNPIFCDYPLYLRRERYHHSKEILHRHHDFLALYIVRGGRGVRVVNGHSHSMARGDVFLMASGTMHCFHTPIDLTVDAFYFQHNLWPAADWNCLCEVPDLAPFLRSGSEGFAARGNTDHFGHLSPELHARVESLLAQMRQALKSAQLPQHLAVRGQFFALLVQLAEWRMTKTFNTRPARGAQIAEVLNFCDHNFHRPLSNEQLAGLMHFSQGHFRAVFTREVGMSPGAYLGHLRLQHAQKLLEDKALPISDVARLSGFGDTTQLGRAFKKAFGIAPLSFRKQLKFSA